MREMQRHRAALDRVWFELEQSEDGGLEPLLPSLREVFDADGVLASIAGDSFHDGLMLREPAAARCASGVLHVPFGQDSYLTFLRREEAENVAWAGRGPDDVEADAVDGSLGPRTSFEIWRETQRGHAKPWSSADVESAEQLRSSLVERRERIELERRAKTDELTSLANRAGFEEALGKALADARRAGKAVLAIDLDRFKEVNDTFGHPVGDDLLMEVGKRLRTVLRDADLAARIGGDEFAAFLNGVADAPALAYTAARVVGSLSAPYRLDDHEIEIGASVGAAFVASAGDTVAAVMARADEALYVAKRAGRGRYALADGNAEGATRAE